MLSPNWVHKEAISLMEGEKISEVKVRVSCPPFQFGEVTFSAKHQTTPETRLRFVPSPILAPDARVCYKSLHISKHVHDSGIR